MLFVYDFEFNLILVEPSVIKSRWVVYYNNVGTFEVHLPITSELLEIISKNPYLVVKEHGLSAIIVGKEIGEELILYGRTCNWLLTKRITTKILSDGVFAGQLASELVSSAFSDVPEFVIGTVVSGAEVMFEKEEGTAFDAVSECLALSGLGHELCFDEKERKWVFNILSGTENDLILSEAHRNSYDTKMTGDILNLATCGIYDKKTADGYESTYIVGDAGKTGIYRWEEKLSGETETEAQINLGKLSEKNEISMRTCDIFWGKDYALGDVLSLQINKGTFRKREKRRVKGVEIYCEQGVYREQPIFE